ncbi:hypothetical protein CMI47_21330, partial [Candidatus Pacearchaeota archaeon]|nr:hypothetical protein [Candidatus Pacearchaeota archaeon]
MAVINYKTLNTSTDVVSSRTILHEAIPLTGTIISGTYGVFPNEANIKNFSHGMFQSVYDYPYLSSSANQIFDITIGYSADSPLSGAASSGSNTGLQVSRKINMYNQMSHVLLGITGSSSDIRKFETDLSLDNSNPMKECVFLDFSRLLTKDQIKKGTFSLSLGTGSWKDVGSGGPGEGGTYRTLTDANASQAGGTSNTLGGDYGVLVDSSSVGMGVVFYEAGIVCLHTGAFLSSMSGTCVSDYYKTPELSNLTIDAAFQSSSISGNCDAVRHRIMNLSFNNSVEINSTIYFCRLPTNLFNYSANPTYLSASQIRVKTLATDDPVAYIT